MVATLRGGVTDLTWLAVGVGLAGLSWPPSATTSISNV